MALLTLRAGDEVRAAQFNGFESELDEEMVSIAEMIVKRRAGSFDPATFRDRYQEALRELIEAKLKGLPVPAKPAVPARSVLDLMAALKRSLEQETRIKAPKPQRHSGSDRRQRNLLLPVSGKPKTPEAVRAPRPRRQSKG